MDKVKSIALLAGLTGALAACNAGGARPEIAVNRGLDSVNQPVVERTDYVFDLPAASNGLSDQDRGRLDAWFASLRLGYGDRIWIDEPYGPGPARHDVARIAAEYGMLLSDGAPITPGELESGGVRVIVGRSVAHVPGCPNWGSPSDRSGPSATSPNYGCAVNSNLAAMIANPSDLVLGQESHGTGDAAETAKAVKVYRDRVPTSVRGITTESSKGNAQ